MILLPSSLERSPKRQTELQAGNLSAREAKVIPVTAATDLRPSVPHCLPWWLWLWKLSLQRRLSQAPATGALQPGFQETGVKWTEQEFVQRLTKTGGSHCLEIYLCVPEDCRTKTHTWLFWQELEGLDYPFPPHESGHLRCSCWRNICFSTNRALVWASPWSSQQTQN